MKPLEYCNGVLKLIDQTLLPGEQKIVELKSYAKVADAIKDMIVRGAPAIGVTAAYGVAIASKAINTDSKDEFFTDLVKVCDIIKSTRPTAVNLFWAVDRVYNKAVSNRDKSIEEIKNLIEEEAHLMEKEDIESNRSIGRFGNELIKENWTILTHCNAGALATCDYGTALGVIRAAHESGKNIRVFADETRPYLQGSRLTAWELMQDNIPVTLICDNMAGHFMKEGLIDCVIVGADRIALNGDTANKIGTYSVAVLAKENNIPFYVAAPTTTIDFSIETGKQIPIEERSPDEITHIKGVRIAPEGVNVKNPAFDVTPNKYISAIITDKGIIYPPYNENIEKYK
ncbi:S-methyl-5-thioribose-1-phosphate isomerase [Acetivibrio mesophilus]|uniref:Methylthioribose-1-phosphate isomerase n=1 Tax=Acetivibrio mesophilus TaxID=2487273 RepID=A0A4V1K2F9_9FIRM|nr:S-methyl-5-thioribose-1-phosphate isomerase [Acetivibrio mesophilus]ODM25564.1 S-methyl-5-thioribose-1-phosphate isomerase [Clostridium sp. Bc-iso-3]RXE60149.1 S-methyl-5-thioribose-1-phosphate isomerase [Acetivibrio mesophilus]HHV29093.1 S-methyl-5-thioribose-1-phosphate isomerase [Clostridium sp.]